MVGISFDSIRINGKDIPIDSNDKLQEIFSLMSLCLRYTPASTDIPVSSFPHIPTEPQEVPTRYRPTFPPVGERMIDYATKSAIQLGHKFTLHELADRMVALGWKTRSDSVRLRSNTVRSTLRDHPDFVNHSDGYWSYNPKKQNSTPINDVDEKVELDLLRP